ncbi:multicopper oxidase domain-containing protein [Streptomyces sp. NBC_01476]|uniref:multicopper oxidase domain-containing protein n=1 Tax=Streptomyces sp. NBC_01476 TaxID=2903881 RepID=UPI002E30D763|nr:multicopper oxidase domain-containing protein [Streptomyces sp. NBC_01476]
MSSEFPDATPTGRRTLLRAMTGGGALAALTLPGAGPAAAATTTSGAGDADPFVQDRFRPTGRTREYWVQADSFAHNVAPNGYDGMTGMHFTADQTTYQAIGFRAYTRDWGRPLAADEGPDGVGANSGIPGPVLRGKVGDVIKVHFKNNDTHYKWPHSMHPHGVRYDQDSDGGWMADDPQRPGTAVPFGGTYTYTWTCTPGSVGSWPYHDHAAPQSVAQAGTGAAAGMSASAGGHGGGGGPVMEIGAELGLFGMIAVTGEQTPPVDREFVLFFHDVSAADAPSLAQDVSLCNGGAFVDNAATFTARPGDRVRWRVGTLGNSFHVFHLHGHRWRTADGWVDSQVIGPATTLTVEYLEDNPGDWIYHCHVPGHMMRGMAGRYRVTR